MTFQDELFHEDLHDALRHCVQAMGGMKRVGATMRPELPADQAGRWLADALKADRRETLSLQHLLMLLQMARQAGVHTGMAFLSREAGYAEPVPVEPDDQVAELQRQFIDSTQRLAALARDIERLTARPAGARAANGGRR
jgi:hypothetical protein